jgi:putative membrane protein
MFAAPTFADPWRFEANPEVYLLVVFLIGAYVYAARVIGPRAVLNGPVLKRSNIVAFVGAMTLLFVASTWPIHQIAEQYLYSVHMVQHMMLSYFLPPLILLATPEWLLRVLVGNGRFYSAFRFMCRPVVAAVVFNVSVMVTHIPGVVNASVESAPLHYALHLLLVLTATLMWMTLVGPFRELHIGYGAKCIYLFLQSVVPTVPAGWLTFAEGAVYKHYDIPVRVWGISVTDDQQLAGAIMKIGGAAFLWTIVVFWFFRRFAPNWAADNTYRRSGAIPTAEITGHDEHPLTFDEVTAEFDRSSAPAER